MVDTQPKLEEKTVKELRAEAVKLGMLEVDAKTFTVKAPLIATINALKVANEVKKVDSLELKVDPKEEKQDEERWRSKAERQQDFFESQPKVRVLIPLDSHEKQGVVKEVMVNGRKKTTHVSGAVWAKTFNGFMVIIPKGIYTEVSEAVADNIAEEYQQTQQAGKQWLIDRFDPETGKSVRSQLE